MRICLSLAALALTAIFGVGCAAPGGTHPSGVEAPAFSLRLFDGRQVSNADFRGQTVVLNFWATWCVPCREEMPMFEQAWRAERDKQVTFIGVGVLDDEILLRSFLQSFNITYPAGLDEGSISRAYDVKGMPTTVVIGPDGRVVKSWPGPIDRRHLDELIAEARGSA
jgi:peroxiredoxin